MRFSAFFVWGGRVFQEGIAVDTLLAGAGWNPAILLLSFKQSVTHRRKFTR
jgi:hypothetical protein